jgi:general secretion pathway protein L
MARQPEVWAVAGLPEPVVLSGFGESVRLGQLARQTRLNLGLLMLATILSALALMTPTAQLRARALQAVDAFTAATAQATPLVRRRDELYALNDKLKALETIKGELVQPAAVLEYLTKILPDDTYLYSVDVQKAKITASGHTVDASALLQRLSADPRLRGVRSPTAVTRQPGATKEAFTVEFTMASGAAVSQAGQGAAIARIPEAPAAPAGRRADAASRFVIGGSGR